VALASFAPARQQRMLFFLSGKSGDALACSIRMRRHFVVCLSILLAVLFIGTVGAFLLYVPALAVFTTVTLLLGLSLMFALGLITGTRWRRLSLFGHRATPAGRVHDHFSTFR
jgi:L-asparagine transporter-like permease